MQGLLQREKGPEAQSLDQLLKQKDVPDNKQEAFKIGFTEGFMRSQAFTQKSQGMCAMVKIIVASRLAGPAFLSSYITRWLRIFSALSDSLRKTRLIILVLLLIGIYGLSRTPFLSGKGSFSDAGLFQFLFFPTLASTHNCCMPRNIMALLQSHFSLRVKVICVICNGKSYMCCVDDFCSEVPHHVWPWFSCWPHTAEECDLWARQRGWRGKKWTARRCGVSEESPEVHRSGWQVAERYNIARHAAECTFDLFG